MCGRRISLKVPGRSSWGRSPLNNPFRRENSRGEASGLAFGGASAGGGGIPSNCCAFCSGVGLVNADCAGAEMAESAKRRRRLVQRGISIREAAGGFREV